MARTTAFIVIAGAAAAALALGSGGRRPGARRDRSRLWGP